VSYIQFNDEGLVHPTAKTKMWGVFNSDSGFRLGSISWFSHWRKYVYHTNSGTVLDPYCLREIADFCEAKTFDHKNA
jgi:hypothetical protein